MDDESVRRLTAHAVVVVDRAETHQKRNRLRERLHSLNRTVGHVGGRLPVPATAVGSAPFDTKYSMSSLSPRALRGG